MEILISNNYWIKNKVIQKVGNYEEKVYWLLIHPDQEKYPDYVAKVPDVFVVTNGEIPMTIYFDSNRSFQLTFEKYHKIPGKKFPKIIVSGEQLKELYKVDDNFVLALYIHYSNRTNRRAPNIIGYEINIFHNVNDVWLHDRNNISVRKRINSKNTNIIRKVTSLEANKFDELLKKLKTVLIRTDELINLLKLAERNFEYDFEVNNKYKFLSEEEQRQIALIKKREITYLKKLISSDSTNCIRLNIEKQLFEFMYLKSFEEIKDNIYLLETSSKEIKGKIIDLEFPCVIFQYLDSDKKIKVLFDKLKRKD